MNKERELSNCGFVKTILMLLVILGHACAFWSGHWFTDNPALPSRGLNALFDWLNSFHIYAFALVSGYIFTYKINGGGYSHYIPFIKNKVKRLLVPYMFVALVWVVPISEFYFRWDMSYLVKKYVLCINPSQLWFLWMIFGVFVIVWPMRNIMLKNPAIGWIISIALYGVGSIGERIIPNIFCIWNACQYVLFFYIGMRIRDKREKNELLITDKVSPIWWIVLDLLIFAINGALDSRLVIVRVAGIILGLLSHIVGSVMAWSVLQMLASHFEWKSSKLICGMMPYTMPIYLFHQQIMYFTISLLNGKVSPFTNASINFVVALVLSIFISIFLMKWKATRFLIGES